MIEGIWTDAFLYPGDSDRQQYRRDIFLFLETMYPGRFATVSD